MPFFRSPNDRPTATAFSDDQPLLLSSDFQSEIPLWAKYYLAPQFRHYRMMFAGLSIVDTITVVYRTFEGIFKRCMYL